MCFAAFFLTGFLKWLVVTFIYWFIWTSSIIFVVFILAFRSPNSPVIFLSKLLRQDVLTNIHWFFWVTFLRHFCIYYNVSVVVLSNLLSVKISEMICCVVTIIHLFNWTIFLCLSCSHPNVSATSTMGFFTFSVFFQKCRMNTLYFILRWVLFSFFPVMSGDILRRFRILNQ